MVFYILPVWGAVWILGVVAILPVVCEQGKVRPVDVATAVQVRDKPVCRLLDALAGDGLAEIFQL